MGDAMGLTEPVRPSVPSCAGEKCQRKCLAFCNTLKSRVIYDFPQLRQNAAYLTPKSNKQLCLRQAFRNYATEKFRMRAVLAYRQLPGEKEVCKYFSPVAKDAFRSEERAGAFGRVVKRGSAHVMPSAVCATSASSLPAKRFLSADPLISECLWFNRK